MSWLLLAAIAVGGCSRAQLAVEAEVVADDSSGSADQAPGTADDGNTPLEPARAREFEAVINARDPERLEQVVVLGDDHDPVDVAAEMLPDDARVTILDNTFEILDDEAAFVQAHIDGTDPQTVVLFLTVGDDGEWVIVGSTEPQPER